MTQIGMLTFGAWCAIAAFLWLSNRDLCSPAKLAHVHVLYFFLATYINPESPTVLAAYWCLLALVFLFGLWEAIGVGPQHLVMTTRRGIPAIDRAHAHLFTLVIWLLTAIPILAQAYLVARYGGLIGYFAALAFRVRDFAGLGPIIAVIKLMPVLNLLYFGILLATRSAGRIGWLMLGVHTLLTVMLGAFSGSRSQILFNLVLMVIVYNYMRAPMRIRTLVAIALPLAFLGLFLGVVRSRVNIADYLSHPTINAADASPLFRRAIDLRRDTSVDAGIGMRLIFDQGVPDPKFGQTLIAAVTTLVPRNLWPDKPRTGGVVLTQDYTKNAWGGLSNLATGIFAEGMLNFGILGGMAIAILIYCAFQWLLLRAYFAIRSGFKRPMDLSMVFFCVVFVWSNQFAASLPVGEFAAQVDVWLLQVTSLALIVTVLRFFQNHLFAVHDTPLRHPFDYSPLRT